MNTTKPFQFSSPTSFYVWYGDVAIAYRLLTEWGWQIERREPADNETLAHFLASAPEPGTTEEREQVVLSCRHGRHLLATYFSFGALREIYSNYPVPIIEITVQAGSDLARLGDVPDFYLDLMLDQRFYFVYVRDGVLWQDEMQEEFGGRSDRYLVSRGDETTSIEWSLSISQFPGYGKEDRVVFFSNLGLNLHRLGLPFQHWQKRDHDIVNEVLDISHSAGAISLTPA